MDNLRIKFKGLKVGQHYFQFKVDDKFFNEFEESEIEKGNVDVNVEMIVSNNFLTLNFRLKGIVDLQCDRCLENFSFPINYKTELYVEFGEKNSDISDADNKIILSTKESEIVLNKHIYDYIHLSVPYQKFHPDDENGNTTCNLSMIEKLNELSSQKNKTIDPRWDKLNEIFK